MSWILVRRGDDGSAYLADEMGSIMSADMADQVIFELQAFYDKHDQDEIDAHNDQRERMRLSYLYGEKPKLYGDACECVYVIEALGLGGIYKIGRTTDLKNRLRTLETLPCPIETRATIPTNDSAALERYYHGKYAEYRVNGEWFELPPEALKELLDDACPPQERIVDA